MSNHVQGSAEWLQERCGHVTGSMVHMLLAKDKKTGKPLHSRHKYQGRIVTERIYKMPMESAQAKSLEHGHTMEPFARQQSELTTGERIIQTGFMKHKSIPWVGVSLDGLIGVDGTYESKCPLSSEIHMEYWEYGILPDHAYYAQMQMGLWVSERKWCMFASYDPRAPKEGELYIQHVPRNDLFIKNMEKEVKLFLSEVNVRVNAQKLKFKARG